MLIGLPTQMQTGHISAAEIEFSWDGDGVGGGERAGALQGVYRLQRRIIPVEGWMSQSRPYMLRKVMLH